MGNINFMSGRRSKGSLPPHLEEKKGNYYYVVKIHGKPIWYSLKTRDVSIALKKWAELEGNLIKSRNSFLPSVNISSNEITFSSLCERYIKEVTGYKAERTQKDEKRIIGFLIKQFGEKILSNITRQDIIRYHDSLRAIPYEANHRLAVLHHIFGKAVDWGYIVEFVRAKTDEPLLIHINEPLYQFLCYLKSKRSSIADHLIYHYDNENKKFVPYKSFRRLWRNSLIKAGFKPGEYKFKELRHLANTCMKSKGITVDKRMAVTGHTDIASNEVYTHKIVEDSIDATRSLEVYRPAKF